MSGSVAKPLDLPERAEGGMEAPVIYFEGAPSLGVFEGVGRIVLEAVIYEPTGPGEAPIPRRKIVAHLRGPLSAFHNLRAAINQIEAMVTPPPDQKPN